MVADRVMPYFYKDRRAQDKNGISTVSRGGSSRPADGAAAAAEFPGEGDFVEFKQGLPETKRREAIVAFSNTDGGVVLLGVRDDGQVHGITSDGETIAKIHRSVAGVRNPGRYDVRSLLIGDRTILVLSVGRNGEGFAQMQDGRILVRRGAMNAPVFDSGCFRAGLRR